MLLKVMTQSQFDREDERRLAIKILYFKKLIDSAEVKKRLLALGYSNYGASRAAEYMYENRKSLNYRNRFWKDISNDLVTKTIKKYKKSYSPFEDTMEYHQSFV